MENDSYLYNRHLLCNERPVLMQLPESHCKNLSSAPFKVKTEKKKDSIWHILAPSLIGLFLCIACFCGTTWAWFSVSRSSNIASVKTASYEVNIGLTDSSQTNKIELLDGKSTYRANLSENHSYTFCLEAEGEATTGFCKITFEGMEYYTDQIAKDSSLSFTVNTSQNKEIQIECFWGTCAVQDGIKISNGSVVGTPVSENQDVQSITADTTMNQSDAQENSDLTSEESTTDSVDNVEKEEKLNQEEKAIQNHDDIVNPEENNVG